MVNALGHVPLKLKRSAEPAATPTVSILRTLTDLDQRRWEWESLGRSRTPMHHHAWARAWAEAASLDGTLEVVIAGPDTSAIAPLFRSKTHIRRLELISCHGLGEPMDFLYSRREHLRAIADTLVASGMPLALDRLVVGSPVIEELKRAYRGRGLVLLRPDGGSPYIPLDSSWEEPERHLNAGRRSDLRRAFRQAGKIGPVSFEVLSPAPEELPPLLDEVYGVEAAGWKGATGSALLRDRLRGSFYRLYGAEAARMGVLRVCFMRIGGRAVATQLAVACGGGFWLLKVGYSEEFARCSPGMLLTVETVRHAARAGLASYEFLGSVEPWTRVWTGVVHECTALRAYPANLRGLAALAQDAGTLACRQMARAIRGEKR